MANTADAACIMWMEAQYKLGSSLPLPSEKYSDNKPGMAQIKDMYRDIKFPADPIGRTAYVHTTYVGPFAGWRVQEGAVGVVLSFNRKYEVVNLTSKGCGVFPIPAVNLYIGADEYHGSISSLRARHCHVRVRHEKIPASMEHCFIFETFASCLLVKVSNKEKTEQHTIPGGIVSIYAPMDAADKRLRVRRKMGRDTEDLVIGTLGYVEESIDNGSRVKVMTLAGKSCNTYANEWDYGTPRDQFTFKMPEPFIRQITPKDPGGMAGMWKHGHCLLDSLSKHVPVALKGFSGAHFAEFGTAEKKTDLAVGLQDGIRLASPELLQVFAQKNITMHDIVKASKKIGGGSRNKSWGVYLRWYGKFKSEERKHQPHWPYTGSTDDMDKRDNGHTLTETSGAKPHSIHYIVARDATEKTVVQLFELPKRFQGRPGRQSRRILEVYEVMFMLFLHTHHSDLCKWEIEVGADVVTSESAQAYIANNVGWREMASALTKIAAHSFKTSGWPATREMLGFFQGLNLTCPVDSRFGTDVHEKTVWAESIHVLQARSAMTVGDLTIPAAPRQRVRHFLRGEQNLTNLRLDSADGVFVLLKLHRNLNVNLPMDMDELKGSHGGPQPGTKFWLLLAIYEDGENPCPYLRIAKALAMSNALNVLSFSAQIFWLDGGQLRHRYVTAPMSTTGMEYQDTEGLRLYTQRPHIPSKTYEAVTSIMAYLRGEDIVQSDGARPEWVPDLGQARTFLTTTDHFSGVNEARYVEKPSTQRLVQPDFQQSRQIMEALGLQRVGDPFPSSIIARPESLPYDRYHNNGSCDRCFVIVELCNIRLPEGCQQGNGDTCKHCFAHGLQCSWTPSEVLLRGVERNIANRPPVHKLRRFQLDLVSALVRHTTPDLPKMTATSADGGMGLASIPLEDIDEYEDGD